jgi:hypothetical protein
MQSKKQEDIKLYTVYEVAAILKLQYRTVLKILNNGFIKYIDLNLNRKHKEKKLYRVEHREILRYLNCRRVNNNEDSKQ